MVCRKRSRGEQRSREGHGVLRGRAATREARSTAPRTRGPERRHVNVGSRHGAEPRRPELRNQHGRHARSRHGPFRHAGFRRKLVGPCTTSTYTGEVLEQQLVAQAKAEELTFFAKKGGWESQVGSWSHDRRPTASELSARDGCHATWATLRTLKSGAGSQPKRSRPTRLTNSSRPRHPWRCCDDVERSQVTLADIFRTYFNASIDREVFAELPSEASEWRSSAECASACTARAVPPTAGRARMPRLRERLGSGGAEPAHVCSTIRGGTSSWWVAHGGDFWAAALPADLKWFEIR